jgi:phytoene dehydrogenase-like protein
MTYDAIVIGSGHNGLAAAVHLARKGWKVGVFERASQAGGAAKTAEVTLPGFRHDLYATNLGLFAGSPFFRAYQEPLLRHGLGFVPAEHCFATPFPDGTWFGVSKGVDQTAPRVGAFSSADERTWRAMSDAFGADAPHLFGLLGSPIPSLAALGVVYRAGKARGKAFMADTARMLLSSPRAFLDRQFESEKVKATLAAWGMHLDFPPDMAGGALFPYLESMADQAFGMVLGQGGADTMIKALTGYLAELGGELHLGAEVAAITVNGKHATGIRLTDGRQFSSSAPARRSSPTLRPPRCSAACCRRPRCRTASAPAWPPSATARAP